MTVEHPWVEEYEPFEHVRRCRACGRDDEHPTQFIRQVVIEAPEQAWFGALERTCSRCGYVWLEATCQRLGPAWQFDYEKSDKFKRDRLRAQLGVRHESGALSDEDYNEMMQGLSEWDAIAEKQSGNDPAT